MFFWNLDLLVFIGSLGFYGVFRVLGISWCWDVLGIGVIGVILIYWS